MESHSTRSEAASEELDGPTLAAMFRAETVAAELINANPNKYAHYFLDEVKGLLEPDEFQGWRLLYGPPRCPTPAHGSTTPTNGCSDIRI